ncbi:MAG: large-conductance mechanosensitive channel protein MscL [Vulcanimicrobiota bacterium]
MSFMSEFREFAVKGNVMDMAVGVIVGGAFGQIVTSFIDNVVMPPLGLVIGGVDFSNLGVTLKEAQGEAPAVIWKYGAFLQTVMDFMILAMCIFLMVKAINRWKNEEPPAPEAPAEPTEDIKLLAEIRDLLKKE